MSQSQTEGAEEDFQRWMKEARDYEMGITDKPPTIYGKDMSKKDKESKLKALARWLKTL